MKTQYFEQVQTLQAMLEPEIDEILSELGVKLNKNGRMYFGKCPVHGGDNPSGINIYHNLDENGTFNWRCNTHHCERIFTKTIIGLIRGILSHQELGWSAESDKIANFKETIQWCEDYLHVKLNNLKLTDIDISKQNFIKNWIKKANGGNNPNFLLPEKRCEKDSKYRQITLSNVDMQEKSWINSMLELAKQAVMEKCRVELSSPSMMIRVNIV